VTVYQTSSLLVPFQPTASSEPFAATAGPVLVPAAPHDPDTVPGADQEPPLNVEYLMLSFAALVQYSCSSPS